MEREIDKLVRLYNHLILKHITNKDKVQVIT